MSSLDTRASNLLNHCLKNNDWEPNETIPAIVDFINETTKDKDLISTWYIEPVLDILFGLLDNYKDRLLEQKPPVSMEIASDFANRFRSIMMAAPTKHWVVMPIHKLHLNNTIEFDNFLFIPDKLPRNSKLAMLAEKSSITKMEMNERAKHTEKTRSPNFYDYTLMCHKVLHHTSFVNLYGTQIMLADFAILRVLRYAYGTETKPPVNFMTIQEARRVENTHIVINSKNSTNWGHFPLWHETYGTTMLGDLDWLQDTVIQNKFTAMNNAIGYLGHLDTLAFRFRRAIMFFSKAIDMQLSSRPKIFEGYGLELLHLMISAESILLDREAEKRLRLSTIISRLVSLPNYSAKDIFTCLNDSYNWRSDYVHSGDDIFPEYDADFNEGEIQKKIYLVRRIIAQLLSDTPKFLDVAKTSAKSFSSTKNPNEKAWFQYLDNIWVDILSGSESSSSSTTT